MEAETPQTEPPTPITAHNLLSRPKRRVPAKKIVRQVSTEISVAWPSATGPAVATSVIGKVAPSSTIPSLMKYSTRNAESSQPGKGIRLATAKPNTRATSGASKLYFAASAQPEIANMASDST